MSKRQYFYGVYCLGDASMCGVFANWNDAQDQIAGIHNRMEVAKVKKFTHRSDAEYFARHGRSPATSLSQPPPDPNTLHIYTDGSAGTGADGKKRGGIGIYFGPNNPNNCGLPLIDDNPTNNRAELVAIKKALELARPMDSYDKVVIYTDSSYARDCLGVWRSHWAKTNFRNNTIQNRDIIESTWLLLDRFPREVEIVWLKGHAGNVGNEKADALARLGSGL